jgi:hypothetical protein
MNRLRLSLFLTYACLAVMFSGCGSSSQPSTSPSPLSVTTTSSLPQGVVSTSYTTTLIASGGTTPYGWNAASGSLPPGLSLSRAGVLSGTPTASGSFSFGVPVSDSQQPPSRMLKNYVTSLNSVLRDSKMVVSGVRFALFLRLLNVFSVQQTHFGPDLHRLNREIP